MDKLATLAICPLRSNRVRSSASQRNVAKCHKRSLPPFAEWEVVECRRDDDGLFRLDVGSPDHLVPLLSLFGNELIEVGGGARKRDAPKVCEVHLQPEISETRIDLLVELLDDLGGCEPPRLRLARYGLRTFRSVWASRTAQRVRSVPMTAGSVTAGKSRAMTDGGQIPTATSQKWKRA